jgi:hypothetical protein
MEQTQTFTPGNPFVGYRPTTSLTTLFNAVMFITFYVEPLRWLGVGMAWVCVGLAAFCTLGLLMPMASLCASHYAKEKKFPVMTQFQHNMNILFDVAMLAVIFAHNMPTLAIAYGLHIVIYDLIRSRFLRYNAVMAVMWEVDRHEKTKTGVNS